MKRHYRRRSPRPGALPEGLRVCPTCHEARGTTPEGRVSACLCSGLVCNGCGLRMPRPISDHYDRRDGEWSHTPYFITLGHACPQPPGGFPGGKRWTILEPDPDVAAYQRAVTGMARAEAEDRARRRRTGS